jgi:hypothetical protein
MASNDKITATRRPAVRLSLGTVCMTCGLAGTWSKDVAQHAPHRLSFGHVVAGTGTAAGRIGAQCAACNYGANYRGVTDQTTDTDLSLIPSAYLSNKAAAEYADPATVAYVPGSCVEDKAARVAARRARGVRW